MDLKLLLENYPEVLDHALDLHFQKLDVTGSGYITAESISREHPYMDLDDMEIIMSAFDVDRTGFIDRPTFKLIFKEIVRKIY